LIGNYKNDKSTTFVIKPVKSYLKLPLKSRYKLPKPLSWLRFAPHRTKKMPVPKAMGPLDPQKKTKNQAKERKNTQ
jgi:hypothetical protein